MICGATSTYCEGPTCWTFTCQELADHAPGEHIYVVDSGQSPLPGDNPDTQE